MGHESTELAHHCARTKLCTRDLGKFRPLAAQELGRAPRAQITQNRPSSESQASKVQIWSIGAWLWSCIASQACNRMRIKFAAKVWFWCIWGFRAVPNGGCALPLEVAGIQSYLGIR